MSETLISPDISLAVGYLLKRIMIDFVLPKFFVEQRSGAKVSKKAKCFGIRDSRRNIFHGASGDFFESRARCHSFNDGKIVFQKVIYKGGSNLWFRNNRFESLISVTFPEVIAI